MPGIIAGTTTVTFRGWKRPMAKVGGRHRVFGQLIEIDEVRLVGANDITEAEARRAGETRAAILGRLGDASAGAIYRIQFHHVGADDRIELRSAAQLDDERRADIRRRLERMDRNSDKGPW